MIQYEELGLFKNEQKLELIHDLKLLGFTMGEAVMLANAIENHEVRHLTINYQEKAA